MTVSGLDEPGAGVQLVLPLDGRDGVALDAALDEVRDRFGSGAVIRAAQLGRGAHLSTRLLPGE